MNLPRIEQIKRISNLMDDASLYRKRRIELLAVACVIIKQKTLKTLGCAACSASLILSYRSSSVRASSTALAPKP